MNDLLLFKDLDTLDSFHIPYCLINNTLLSLYRDNKCFPQEEREVVALVWARERYHMRNYKDANVDVYAESSLGNVNLEGKIAINFMTEIRGKLIINPYLDYFFVYDKETILPFGTLKYKDRNIPIPHDPEKYLTTHYGEWKTPIPPEQWNWLKSKSIIRANGIGEALNKYEQT